MRYGVVLLACSGLLVMLSTSVQGTNTLSCPKEVYIELGKEFTLRCDISENHGDIYWFNVTDTSDVPILWIEKGEPGGESYGKTEFSITSEGDLVFINPGLLHEREYSMLVYFRDGSQETVSTTVNVYITPEPACPSISACPLNCGECQLEVNNTSEIVCSVTGIRPKADIAWEVTNQPGVSTSIGQPEYKQNEDGETWNASVTITYDMDICDGYVVFNCSLLNSVGLQRARSVTLYANDTCTGPLVIVSIITGLMVIILLIIIAFCYYWCRTSHRTMHNEVGLQNEDVPLKSPPSDSMGSKPRARRVDTKQLISSLSGHYKKLLYVKPLPWGEAVEITNLYTSCDCEIRYENGGVATETSEDLFKDEFLSDNKRVLIVADLGFGKTTFAQHTMARWLSLKDGSIFVYILLKDVDRNEELSNIVRNMLPPSSAISCHDIEHILSKNKCHVFLDGLDELGMSEVKQEGIQSSNDLETCDDRLTESCTNDVESGQKGNRSRLTVNSLLQNVIPRDSSQDIRVWVTSRELDDVKNPIALPFAKVTFSGFNDVQMKEYITKTCQYYSGLRGSQTVDVHESDKLITRDLEQVQNKATGTCTPDGTDIESGKEDGIERLVKKSLDMNEIVQDFVHTPLLLSMVIHIITLTISQPDGPTRNVNLNKLTTIVRMIITCLEGRYFQKIDNESEVHRISAVESALGKVAFKQKMGVDVMERKRWDTLIGKVHVDTALAIGLLKQSKHIGKGVAQFSKLVTSSYTGIQFYHQYFQEFFAAQHVPSNKQEEKEFDQFLKVCNDDKTLRYFQFMTGSDHGHVEKVMNKLYESDKMWNNLIDCMFEDENVTRVKRLIEKISEKVEKFAQNAIINVLNLHRQHHQAALRYFCDQCREFRIPIHMMTFREDCSISFMESCCSLPRLNRLVFYDMDIAEDKFIRIMESISKQINPPEKIQFVKCVTPDTFSDSSKDRIMTATKAISETMEVSKKKTKEQLGKDAFFIKKLNLQKVKWQNEWFPSGE